MNENPSILPRTLSIVGALALLKRGAGKKCELRFWACLNLYITSETNDDCDGFSLISMARIEKYRYSPQLKLPRYTKYNKWLEFLRV